MCFTCPYIYIHTGLLTTKILVTENSSTTNNTHKNLSFVLTRDNKVIKNTENKFK